MSEADDLLGAPPPAPAQAAAPSQADQLLGPRPGMSLGEINYNVGASINRVTGAIGTAVADAFSQDQFSGEAVQALRDAKIFNDAEKGQKTLMGSFNEAVLKPVIMGGELAMRAGAAGFSAYQAGVQQLGAEVGQEQLGRDIAALPEDIMARQNLGPVSITRNAALELPRRGLPRLTEQDVAAAQAVHLDDVKPAEQPSPFSPTEEAPSARPHPATPETQAPEPPAAPPDIHTLARQIDPETMANYDALTGRQETYRRWLDDLAETRLKNAQAEAPNADEIGDLQSRLETANPRMTKKYQARLDDLMPDYQAYIDEAVTKDTPDMEQVHTALQQNEYNLRDLVSTGAVKRAYDAAAEHMPFDEPQPVTERAAPAEEQPHPATAETVAPEPKTGQGEPEPVAPSGAPVSQEEQIRYIVNDVAKQLTAAGRPAEEANAAAQLIAARYQARADWFEGKKGTAQDLYNAEGAEIKAGKEQAKTFAQPDEMEQGQQRGRIRIRPNDPRTTISLLKNSDASSFIHESGHDFLEQLRRDSADKEAPAQLVNDMKTVHEWLGSKVGAELTRAQHEKFARGFERYLMEGRAPLAALRDTFEKFRNWLVSIYQSVDKLKAPISDDIRDVYDRLLARNPEKQPAPQPEGLLGAIHETDALHTPDRHAAEVADQIEDELKGVKNVAVGDTEAKAEERGRPAQAGAEQHEAGQGRGAEVGEGTDHAAPEGGEARGKPGKPEEPSAKGGVEPEPRLDLGKTGEMPETPKIEAPEEPFEHQSKYFDRKRGINIDTFNAPEDIEQFLLDIDEANGGFQAARRGTLSVGEQLDLSDALGMTVDNVAARRLGEAYNAEQIRAIRSLLLKSAVETKTLMTRVFENGSPSDVMAFAEARARHLMIQEHFSAVRSEAGRALHALRGSMDQAQAFRDAQDLSSFLEQTQGMTLYQMKEMAERGSNLQNAQQVSKFVAHSANPSFRDKILFYYVNSLISGPITHLRYSVGNAISALSTPLLEIPASVVSGKIAEAFGRESDEHIYLGEAKAQLYAMTKGAREGLSAAAAAFRTGISPLLPGEQVSAHYGENSAIPIGGMAGKIIGIPVKSVAAIHSFFKSLRYEQNVAGLAFRTAMNEGLEGDAFERRIAQLTTAPTREMVDAAVEVQSVQKSIAGMIKRAAGDEANLTPNQAAHIKGLRGQLETAQEAAQGVDWDQVQTSQAAAAEAMKTLYMRTTDFNSFSGKLQSAINSNLLAKVIVPFMKIGSEITREAFMERTPLGAFDQTIRDNLLGRNGPVAADFQRGKMLFGTALMGTTALMVSEGVATGDGPSDPAERAVWLLSHKPNSIAIGGVSIPYQGLGHLGMLMRFSANMTETASGWGDEKAGDLAKSFMEGITRAVLDENFMRGMKDMLDAVYHPTEYGSQYVRSFITNWLPVSIGMRQVANQIDPYRRQVQDLGLENGFGLLDDAKNHVPFLSMTLAPKRDVFGEPISGDISKYARDPVVQQLDALDMGISKIPKQILGIDLSADQHDDYARVAGRMTKMMLDDLVDTKGWNTVPDWAKAEVIQKTVDQARKSGRAYVMSKNPDIMRQAIEEKRHDANG